MSYCIEENKRGDVLARKALLELKDIMFDTGFTSKDLAEKMGVTEHYIESTLNGTHISITQLGMLAALMGMEVDFTFTSRVT